MSSIKLLFIAGILLVSTASQVSSSPIQESMKVSRHVTNISSIKIGSPVPFQQTSRAGDREAGERKYGDVLLFQRSIQAPFSTEDVDYRYVYSVSGDITFVRVTNQARDIGDVYFIEFSQSTVTIRFATSQRTNVKLLLEVYGLNL
ncbi:hypothetical protein WA026_003825 [Henosepilachna vigintioctopunctata]|uniref:Salivary secreted peptide n=1 Tax=Henosepilachna vigintioctopunctata TaxID=420089 RepID=A0AAW1U5S8_9CUCU